eukprot:COSAG03_NODE_17504_length_374_cov_0.741818_2_plen_92_part_01
MICLRAGAVTLWARASMLRQLRHNGGGALAGGFVTRVFLVQHTCSRQQNGFTSCFVSYRIARRLVASNQQVSTRELVASKRGLACNRGPSGW